MPIINAWGVVLSRRNLSENDHLSVIYTENFGKIPVRFVGVKKPGRKMKALSEPLAWGEYRLYLSARTQYGKAIGGQLIGTFPEIRADFAKTVAALGCCELMSELAPDHSPNAEKYRLLCAALALLSHQGSPWIPVAFGLQLLALAGVGLGEAVVSGLDKSVWRALHEMELAALADLNYDAPAAARADQALRAHVEMTTGRALKTSEFRRQMQAAPPLC